MGVAAVVAVIVIEETGAFYKDVYVLFGPSMVLVSGVCTQDPEM